MRVVSRHGILLSVVLASTVRLAWERQKAMSKHQEMIEDPGMSERQRRDSQRAMSVRCFCDNFGVGRTTFYAEVRSGRLRVRKIGRRTLVLCDDAEDWLNRLPTINGAVR
jgi:hypothetical protein